MSTVDADAIAELRRQQEQGRISLGILSRRVKEDSLQKALERAERREHDSTEQDGFIYSSGLRYPARTERQRWARTRDIINRASPGEDEDASYLEMIARQAASIEMIMRGESSGKPIARNIEICDRVLLGTIPTINPDAYSRRFKDFYYVLVSAGLIEFAYQAAKAAVLSWRPTEPSGGAAFAFKNTPADIDAVLKENPYPLQLLKQTLEAYLFEGRPRTGGFSPPSQNYQAPLQILTNFNERFIIAHEYGHTLLDALDIVPAGASAWNEEFTSDVFAFNLVVQSGWELDRLPPNFSSQGAYFVLAALDVIRKTLDIIRHGAVWEDRGSASHPPIANRIKTLEQAYLQTVSDKDNDDSIQAALAPARTLDLLWTRLVEQGVDQWRTGRAPHRIWSAT